MKNRAVVFLVLALAIVSCNKLLPGGVEDAELLDGPVAGLTPEQNAIFLKGDAAFNQDVFTPQNGLGPLFVSTSCGSCHAGDGKGHPSTSLTRFGQTEETGNAYLEYGGPQLQNHAIPGFTPETLPTGTACSKFTPPANTGLGFLEALTDASILENADPDDEDGDGISGVVNWVYAPDYFIPGEQRITQNDKYIGRFGKKAAAVSLLHQTVNAYIQDMGITTDYHMEDLFHFNNGSFATDDIADPEVPAATVNNVVFYLQTLKAPMRRNEDEADVLAGEMIFSSIQCRACHTPELQTGYSPISALSYKTIHPYTDMLLHDLGPALDDGYTEGGCYTWEWRTPALWGLGLSKNSQGGEYFLLHDGRAHSIEEAILFHGGEAATSVNAYTSLTPEQKEQLIKFLESL